MLSGLADNPARNAETSSAAGGYGGVTCDPFSIASQNLSENRGIGCDIATSQLGNTFFGNPVRYLRQVKAFHIAVYQSTMVRSDAGKFIHAYFGSHKKGLRAI